MTPLELLLTGEKKPSELFGRGYNGPPKPSDLSTLAYLVLAVAAFTTCWWVVVFK